jgi:acyl-CoA synthetase (AMP-forming)/AMP-acid ligase II
VLAALIGNPFLFKVFDLSSVDSIYVGAGGVSADLHAKTKAVQPDWNIVTGYGNRALILSVENSHANRILFLGLTESPAAVAMSSPKEFMPGSIGILLPMYRARLQHEDGSEIEGFGEAGELLLSSPNQAVGYLGDDETSATTFRDGWLHTGDVAVFRQSPKGDSHLYIVDRLRDMIKVKVSHPELPLGTFKLTRRLATRVCKFLQLSSKTVYGSTQALPT